jgi:23S rRNA (pseudouridine1915-N3)-methyltransferase
MKIVLLLTGKTSARYIEEGINEYSFRIRKYSDFEIVTIPDIRNTRKMPTSVQMEMEGDKILRFLKDNDYLVMLDERGKEFSTFEFSSWLERSLSLQKKRIMFVIGGSWGIAEGILGKADIRISLSRLTFSHQMVRLLFLEQLYRAFTIIKGDPYHHE